MSPRMSPRWVARTGRGDREAGQTLLLVLGYVVLAALLVTLVTDASRVFLAERALAAAADGAAVAAASGVDEPGVYAGSGAGVLPLSAEGGRARVARYVSRAELPARFPGFAVTGVATDGQTATVGLAARVPLPFTGRFLAAWSAGYPISATASARAPLR